jgi:hypothetical protein
LNGLQSIEARKDELIEACAQYKIVWNLPYTQANVLEILHTYKPYSIVILAATEEKTGMKEYDELNEMLEILRP